MRVKKHISTRSAGLPSRERLRLGGPVEGRPAVATIPPEVRV